MTGERHLVLRDGFGDYAVPVAVASGVDEASVVNQGVMFNETDIAAMKALLAKIPNYLADNTVTAAERTAIRAIVADVTARLG